jgi:hypothetical protein
VRGDTGGRRGREGSVRFAATVRSTGRARSLRPAATRAVERTRAHVCGRVAAWRPLLLRRERARGIDVGGLHWGLAGKLCMRHNRNNNRSLLRTKSHVLELDALLTTEVVDQLADRCPGRRPVH